MAIGDCVAYYRVSTDKQGRSGLGLEAQRIAVMGFLKTAPVQEFTEVESGKQENRPEFLKAMRVCRLTNATLVIAKLDRLSRNAGFLLGLKDSGVRFICADMPDANELTINIMAVMAEHERRMISERTKVALNAAKQRQSLGNPNLAAVRNTDTVAANAARAKRADAFSADLAFVIDDIKHAGITSLLGISKELNSRGFTTRKGHQFSASTVSRTIKRTSKISALG